jgi:uncharacterized membrane protein
MEELENKIKSTKYKYHNVLVSIIQKILLIILCIVISITCSYIFWTWGYSQINSLYTETQCIVNNWLDCMSFSTYGTGFDHFCLELKYTVNNKVYFEDYMYPGITSDINDYGKEWNLPAIGTTVSCWYYTSDPTTITLDEYSFRQPGIKWALLGLSLVVIGFNIIILCVIIYLFKKINYKNLKLTRFEYIQAERELVNKNMNKEVKIVVEEKKDKVKEENGIELVEVKLN